MRTEVAVLVGIVLGVVALLAALLRRPPQADRTRRTLTLRYRSIVPAAGILSVLAALAVAGLLALASSQQKLRPETYEIAYAMVAGFLLLGAPLLVVWFGSR